MTLCQSRHRLRTTKSTINKDPHHRPPLRWPHRLEAPPHHPIILKCKDIHRIRQQRRLPVYLPANPQQPKMQTPRLWIAVVAMFLPCEAMEKPPAEMDSVALFLDCLDLVHVWGIADSQVVGTENEAVDSVPDFWGEAEEGGEGVVAMHTFCVVSEKALRL